MIQKSIYHLNNVILPFWKSLKDEKGFYGEVTYNLEINKHAVKGIILNSRILWFFSNAYLVAKDIDSLKYANHSYNFLKNYCIDNVNGGVYWSCNSDGSPHSTEKHTYNLAFAIYALSSYYEATKEEGALSIAFQLFDVIESKCKDEIGYNESFNINFELTENDKLGDNKEFIERGIKVEKTMNTVLHLIEAYTEFFKITKREDVKRALIKLLNLVYDKVYDFENYKQHVFFDRSYNYIGDVHSYGHDIESAWLIDRALIYLNDNDINKKRFTQFNTKMINNVLEQAFQNNLLYNEKAFNKVDKTRVWWVQAETVVGLINEFEKSKEIHYFNKASKTLDYILNKMVDKRENSEWHWCLDENEKNTFKKPIVESWKCPYHNGRMIFEIIRRGIYV